MTRGGLTIDQKMVDTFIFNTVKGPSDLQNGIDLSELTGEDETVNFRDLLKFLSRGLCLDLQRRERVVETIKQVDIKDGITILSKGGTVQDVVDLLTKKGYTEKTILKFFRS